MTWGLNYGCPADSGIHLAKIGMSFARLFDYLRAGDGGVGLLGAAESKPGSIAKASPLVTLVVPRLAMVETKNYFE